MVSNYPDGMRESDLPGWWDVECPDCEERWADGDETDECDRCGGTGMVDSRDRGYDPDPDPDPDPYHGLDVW